MVNRGQESTTAFIKEGLRSYFEATLAIEDFQEKVFGACEKVFNNNYRRLLEKVGDKPGKRMKIASEICPGSNEQWIGAGRQFTRNYLSAGVWWGKKVRRTERCVSVGLYTQDPGKAEKLHEILSDCDQEPDEIVEQRGVYLSEDIEGRDLREVEHSLQQLFQRWIKVAPKVRQYL